MFTLLKKLFTDTKTIGQQIALSRLHAEYYKSMNELNTCMVNSKCSSYPVDLSGLYYRAQEIEEARSYQDWFINNHPDLIEDDGRIKPQINIDGVLTYVSWDKFNQLTPTTRGKGGKV